MNKRITIVGGSKGGVGKSFVSMAMIDYLQAHGSKVLLIESDTSNPDVGKAYRNDVVALELLNLDQADGWIELLNVCEAHPDCHVVVNSAARSNEGVSNYGSMLGDTLPELQRELTTLWVINRQKDSLELLRSYQKALPGTRIHVLRNGHFGPETKFQLYNDSKIRKSIEQAGGKSVLFPDMADRVADAIYTGRLTIAKAAKDQPIGNRAELLRWRNLAHAMMQEVLGG